MMSSNAKGLQDSCPLIGAIWLQMSQVRNEMWMPATVTKAAFSANFGLSMICVKLCGVWGGALALSITRLLQTVMLLGESDLLPMRCLQLPYLACIR